MNELTLKEKQGMILEIMKDIDRFCRENKIPYTISSGTLLGAVRHGGFIPWDDDADLFMLRKDFDKFVNTYKSDKYHLLFNTRNKDEFLASGYAKVSDPSTFIVKSGTRTHYGVYVDIFPLDSVPSNPIECKKYMHSLMSLHNRIHHKQKKDLFSKIKTLRHSFDWYWNKMDGLIKENKYDVSPLAAHILGSTNYRTVLPKNWFDDLEEIEFEGYKFYGFKDTHSYLSMVFGPDYMTPKKWAHNDTVYLK